MIQGKKKEKVYNLGWREGGAGRGGGAVGGLRVGVGVMVKLVMG